MVCHPGMGDGGVPSGERPIEGMVLLTPDDTPSCQKAPTIAVTAATMR